MNIKQELGEKIKRLRKKQGLTQEQLAEMIDISSRNVSNIELGISFPKPETLEKIIKSLNTTSEELFSLDYIKTEEELFCDIQKIINSIKTDKAMLERVYKILKDII